MPLLEADDLVFDSVATYKLMQSITTYCNDFNIDNDDSKNDMVICEHNYIFIEVFTI